MRWYQHTVEDGPGRLFMRQMVKVLESVVTPGSELGLEPRRRSVLQGCEVIKTSDNGVQALLYAHERGVRSSSQGQSGAEARPGAAVAGGGTALRLGACPFDQPVQRASLISHRPHP